MDFPVGLIIFAAIVVLSLIGKAREAARRADEEGTTGPSQPLDLPDEVRQRLRDRHDVRTAQPAAPQDVEAEDDGWSVVPPPAPQRPLVQQRPVRPAPPRPQRPTPVQTQRRVVVQRATPQGPPPPPPAPRRQAPTRPPSPRQRPARPTQVQRPKRREGPRPTRKQPRAPRPPQPRGRRPVQAATPQRILFENLDDVRRGIVLAEILGPPKALR